MSEKKLLEELKKDPKCQEYLSQFDADSARQFLEYYVGTKEHLLKWGADMRKMQRDNDTHFRELAEKYYWQIFQKKLFNIQCRWRAEQIELPVTVTHEFKYWEENIKTCPFVEDVTAPELDAMLSYLENAPYDHDETEPDTWQGYEEFKYGEDEGYPDWYEAYDLVMGTSSLSSLPDVRGQKEERYMNAWREKHLGPPSSAPRDMSRVIWCDEESIERFIRAVEPYKILDYYRLYKERFKDDGLMEYLEEQLELMNAEPDDVYIPEGKYPDAIFQASHLLKVKKMRTFLPKIHAEHLERRSMGISYEQEETVDKHWLVKEFREHILEGRKLLGEPENFDF